MTIEELLPPGVYPVWSPYNSCEAAEALMKALSKDKAAQKLGILRAEADRTAPVQISFPRHQPKAS